MRRMLIHKSIRVWLCPLSPIHNITVIKYPVLKVCVCICVCTWESDNLRYTVHLVWHLFQQSNIQKKWRTVNSVWQVPYCSKHLSLLITKACDKQKHWLDKQQKRDAEEWLFLRSHTHLLTWSRSCWTGPHSERSSRIYKRRNKQSQSLMVMTCTS